MKKKLFVFALAFIGLSSCSNDNDDTITPPSGNGDNEKDINLTLNFTHNWDGTNVQKSDLNTIKFTNAKGTKLSIERLRYLISQVTLTDADGKATMLEGYNLVDMGKGENLSFTPTTKFKEGKYKVSFTFGFTDEDNYKEGGYKDLNEASFGVPAMLNGGYHYMQFDGKYKASDNSEKGFNYHAIRAAMPGMDGNPPELKDKTFFTVDLGSIDLKENTAVEVKMNIAEWFTTPVEWDLNVYDQKLMPKPDVQKMMYDNGKAGVFSLGEVQ